MSATSAAGCVIAVCLSLALWALYFARYGPAIEDAVARRSGADRAAAATVSTYSHLGIVAGILLVSLGLGQAISGIIEPDDLPMLAAAPLTTGLALFTFSTAIHWWTASGHFAVARVLMGLLILGSIPLLTSATALVALTIVTVVTIGLVGIERRTSDQGSVVELPLGRI